MKILPTVVKYQNGGLGEIFLKCLSVHRTVKKIVVLVVVLAN